MTSDDSVWQIQGLQTKIKLCIANIKKKKVIIQCLPDGFFSSYKKLLVQLLQDIAGVFFFYARMKGEKKKFWHTSSGKFLETDILPPLFPYQHARIAVLTAELEKTSLRMKREFLFYNL